MKDEVASLQRTLDRLRAMLRDAEEKKVEGERFALWLRELKGAACDAEDVLGEFEYEDLRRKVEESGGVVTGAAGGSPASSSRKRKVRDLLTSIAPREVSFRYKMARRIDDIRSRLEEISKGKNDFAVCGDLDAAPNQPKFKRQIKETSSLLLDHDVFGRDKERNMLIGLLLGTIDCGSSSSSSYSVSHPTDSSVLSIVGMGGLGKTTLAQWVYNSTEVQEHFHLRIWVWVSHDFDHKRVIRQILEHVVDSQFDFQNIDSLNVLQTNLVERLQGKRFLLVLDDVWEEDRTRWFEFSAPLNHGGKGSKVLITTRNSSVADMVQSVKIELESLSFDDCWSIFGKHAFPGGNSGELPILKSIGKEIVKKLKGIPLAATTIGGLLRSKSEERKWRNVLQSELWELEQGGEGIFPALKLSYEYLPSHLKECFAYCSVFPKGYEFDILELVQLWMAQGYVQPLGTKPVEDVGRDNFDELFNRSLIQLINEKYVIHDLLHDLGHLILQHDYYKVRDDLVGKFSEDAHFKRHLLLATGALEELHNFRSARSLLIQPSHFTLIDGSRVLHDLFGTMKCLRVLDLSYCDIEILPDSIGYLMHLRYFDLRKTPINCLPKSLCTLYKLQTLKLEGCEQLNILPIGMSNLISLHYLEAKPELVSKIVGIGRLTHLQNLAIFSVSEANENKIGDLKNMNELRGKLCIKNLHLVENEEEALDATLKNKHLLEILEMEWAAKRDIDQIDNQFEESIIECLQAPPHLKKLTIKYYAGINFPSWMSYSSVSSLESVHLNRCINLNQLPHVGQLCSLRTLDITSCSQLKELPCLPTSLRNLILQDVGLRSLPNNLHDMTLQQLVICQIPQLRELPLLPATLKELMVHDVGLHALPELCLYHEPPSSTATRSDDDKSCDNGNVLLSVLKIHGCPYLKTLDEGLLRHNLRYLQVLSIKDCNDLVHWPEGEGFRATLSSLKEELSIERCPFLLSLPEKIELTASLQKLVVKACPVVPNKSLFSQLHNLTSNDVYMEKQYPTLSCCSNEALRHIMAIDWLKIKYFKEFSQTPSSLVSIVYDTERTVSWACNNNYVARRVSLVIREGIKRWEPVAIDSCDGSKLLSTCLGDHTWTYSLRILILDGIPEGIFRDETLMQYPLHLPMLEELRIWSCKEMRRLPTQQLLCHMTTLKRLVIADCPELTLSSVEVGIQSIPSLKVLYIYRCPKLLMEPLTPLHDCGCKDTLSTPPLPPLPPPFPLLQRLTIDDAPLLTQLLVNNFCQGQNTNNNHVHSFCNHFRTSLRVLRILLSPLTSLTAEEGLMTLASSLQCLAFVDCPNLQNLPMHLRSLLPNLKVLHIANCPEIHCLPEHGLPASMEVLCVVGCPTLSKQIRLRPCATSAAMQEVENDWHKVAHIPVIEVDKIFLQGSYSRFVEFKDRWDFIY